MIHNPWSFGVGTADDLHSQAEVVRAAEEKILNFYVEKTGGDKEAIKALMDEETFMASDKAKELGFITEVLDDSKNLVYAKINYKKQPMKKETKDSLIAKFNNVVAALKTELGIKAEVIAVKALDLKLKDSDDTIHIDTEADTAKVGDKVTKGGADVPNETFNLDGGKVLKTDDASLVLSIEDEAAPEEPNAKLVALEQENASLKNEIENLKNSQKESEDFATEIMAKLETLSSQVKSNFTPEQRVQNNGRFNADKSKDKDISDAVEKAKEKIKLRNQQRREGRVK
jgi:ATP-dependent Clp protease protease subunit